MNLNRKQKLLLNLLASKGGDVSELGFQKLLFFLTRQEIKSGKEPSYDFYPFLKGGYSFTVRLEHESLIEAGILSDIPKRWVIKKGFDIPMSSYSEMLMINDIVREFELYDDQNLVHKMYIEYPEYATNSLIAESILQNEPEKLDIIHKLKPHPDANLKLFTIGYEGLSIEEFFSRLYANGVDLLCDVRRVPFSHKKGFSKGRLSDIAHAVGIQYKHFPDLGIESCRRSDLKTQKDYDRLFEEFEREDIPKMRPTLEKLASLLNRGRRIALMCFEANPFQCHRRVLAEQISLISGNEYLNLTEHAFKPCQKLLKF